MYWAVREDGDYEVIDGQQRTLSICQYVNGDFSINGLAFHNLKDDQQQQILDYKLMVYFCSGTDSEKLDWFRTINIAGEEHTDQELRNAVYAGPWTADAKRYFSKTGCAAYGLASDYLRGSPIRQEYLETAIEWRSEGKIEEYMSKHQHDKNATPLWQYFQKVIGWVKATFPEYRREMKGVDWGASLQSVQGQRARYGQAGEAGRQADAGRRCGAEIGNLPVCAGWGRKTPEHPRVLRQHEAGSVREAKGSLRQVQEEVSSWTKWKAITSSPGTRAGRPTRRTARCCARTTIEENRGDEIGLVTGCGGRLGGH